MSRPRPPVVAVAAFAAVVLAAYAALWTAVSVTNIDTADFTATYVAGTLLREGHGASMYDQTLEASLHDVLIAPLRRGTLPFPNPPLSAVVAAPVTLLPLTAAYRLWQALQLSMLALAVWVASRAAPWPACLRRSGAAGAAAIVAFAGIGTLSLGLLGQWDGFSALGLAAAYALWRRGGGFAGGAVLAATAAIAKPHLAIGLAALLLGWRDRRVLAGAAAGLAVVLLASLMAVGPGGLAGFVEAARSDAGRWPLASMLGFTGLFGSWLGNGAAAQLLAAGGSICATGGCLMVGRRLARDRTALEPCLAAATLLSLLASPHLLSHDLVLLAPVLVGLLGWAAVRDGTMPWPGPQTRAVLAGWVVLSLAIALDLGSQAAAPPGRLVPWALLGLAGLLLWTLRPRSSHLRPRPAS
jgi:hypothetical protein